MGRIYNYNILKNYLFVIELQSPNFWIAETSFQSEPVSGDDVDEGTESPGSHTTDPSAPKTKKPKKKAASKPTPKPYTGLQRSLGDDPKEEGRLRKTFTFTHGHYMIIDLN